MIKEEFGVAETIEEAKEIALNKLNADLDADVSIEVVEMPKKKTLGLFGGCPAKVRVYVELPDPAPQKAKKEKPVKAEKTEKPQKEKKTKTETDEAKVAPAKKEEPKREEPVYAPAVSPDELKPDSPAAKAAAYVATILTALGCEGVEMKVALREGGAKIILAGEGLGVVIGHRGETLDAMQYLSSLAAGSAGGYYKVTLDIGNYREKRERTLVALAHRMADQVLRTGRNRTLEPMNPYERRIIHTAIQEIEGVESNSIGEGSGRRVVISPVGGFRKPEHRDRRDDRRRGGGRGERYQPAVDPNREQHSDSAALPLYGKIK